MFFLVVIATVFLTIIGMAAGLVLGERHKDRVRAEQAQRTVTPAVRLPEQRPAPVGTDPVPLCPDETQRIAAEGGYPSDLRQILKVVTDNETTAWICQDAGGSLYYQGKTGGAEQPLVQHKNGLFLTEVQLLEGPERYEATAPDGTVVVVSREQLEVRRADGSTQINQVQTAE
jgi:hypothetical protein